MTKDDKVDLISLGIVCGTLVLLGLIGAVLIYLGK